MVRLTLRMMERSCFWARIWAISYRGREKKKGEIEIGSEKVRHNNITIKKICFLGFSMLK